MSATLTGAASALYEHLNWPDTSEETWRRTDLVRLLPKGYLDDLAAQSPRQAARVKSGNSPLLPDNCAARVITESGIPVAMALTESASLAGLTIGWAEPSDVPAALEASGRAEMEQSPDRITAWHWRDMPGSLIIHVPQGAIIDKPVIIEERLIGPKSAGPAIPHLHVHAEKSSSLSVIWSFEGAPEKTTSPLVNAGLTSLVEENAMLDITVRQNLGTGVSFFLHDRMDVARDARLSFRETHLGGTLVKTQARVILNGEGADARLNGLYVAGDSCHLDIGTIQEHRSPRATSKALYKGAVNPGGRTIHRGLIVVSPQAAKTDAYLTNNNLVLGDGARADSIPQLNILTDDVKCSHGSTTGKLDQAQLFYLQSRGFSPGEATRELTRGFLAQVLIGAPQAVSDILSGDLDAALNFSQD